MNIPEMAAMAREHWKKTNRETYNLMVKNKELVAESEAAARLTLREMQALMTVKMSEQEAWQESRHLFIFLTKEKLAESYRPDLD